MKNTILKLVSLFAIFILAVSGFAQRGGSSFGGGGFSSRSSFSGGSSFGSRSSSFGGGRSYSSSSSFGSRRSSFGGGTTPYATNRSSFGSRTGSFGSSRTYSTNRVSYRSSYRVGYRPSLSVHYYGRPYSYMGHSLYWYGGGWYSYSPGGPLYMGNVGMPGYADAYGYDPTYVGGGMAPAPVAVAPNPFVWVLYVAIGLIVIIALIFLASLF